MRQKNILLLSSLVVSVFLFCAWQGNAGAVSEVCLKNQCFKVEVAAADEARRRGLQGRTSLDDQQGMLFVFDSNFPYRFWMKDTLISLDMIWLDENLKVVYVEKNVPPCREETCPSYGPTVNARYVLEINAGMSDQLAVEDGVAAFFKFAE
jgi:uncharacterized membrane protein (UPF0127 family)